MSGAGHGLVFVDTGAFAALAINRDEHHLWAVNMARELDTGSGRLVTTNLIVAETYGLILARAGRDRAFRMLTLIDQRPDDIVRVSDGDEQRARAIITQYRDKTFSLVDAVSFAVMERPGINDAFAFDRHFAQFGFRLIAD